MTAVSKISVTLSGKMFDQLRARALNLEVSLEWLVAGLVCDSMEDLADGRHAANTRFDYSACVEGT
jgi:hypothetical protein